MHNLTDTFDSEEFALRLRQAERRILMLDYDGTLAPFVEDRDRAFPYPGVREAIAHIRSDSRNRLVIVTGRSVDDVLPLLALTPPPEIWGSHGYEHRLENGLYMRHHVPPLALEAIEAAQREIRQAGLGDRLETKPLSLAVHWRGTSPEEAQRIEETARTLLQQPIAAGGLLLHAFDGGLELRIPGRDKGDAVRAVLDDEPSSAVAAYFGDDLTDEDAFKALNGQGIGVLVRSDPRETRADVRISPPEELLEWLGFWALPGST